MGSPGDYQYQGAFPSVSKEQWVKHAIKKLSKGYVLIISEERGVANFYKGTGDLEPCSLHTAHRLVRQGFVQPSGEHALGSLFEIKPEFREDPKMKPAVSKPPVLKQFDEDDVVLEAEGDDAELDESLLSDIKIDDSDGDLEADEDIDEDSLIED